MAQSLTLFTKFSFNKFSSEVCSNNNFQYDWKLHHYDQPIKINLEAKFLWNWSGHTEKIAEHIPQ